MCEEAIGVSMIVWLVNVRMSVLVPVCHENVCVCLMCVSFSINFEANTDKWLIIVSAKRGGFYPCSETLRQVDLQTYRSTNTKNNYMYIFNVI